MIPLDPVALTGQPQTVQLWQQGQLGAPIASVLVQNESPLALQISIAGATHWLGPWTANVYPANGATKLLVNPFPITSSSLNQQAPSQVLLISIAPAGETIPGTYPAALSRSVAAPRTRINPACTITQAADAGATQVTVDDTSVLQDADPVYINTSTGGPGQQTTGPYVIDAIDAATGVITLEEGLTYPASVGDLVVLLPTVQLGYSSRNPVSPVIQSWQAASATGFCLNTTLAVGAHVGLVAAGSGPWRLWGLTVDVQTTGTGVLAALQDTSGNTIASFMLTAGPRHIPLYRQLLASGLGVQIANVDNRGSTGPFSATVSYGPQ